MNDDVIPPPAATLPAPPPSPAPPFPGKRQRQNMHVVMIDERATLYTGVLTAVLTNDGTLSVYGDAPRPKYSRRKPVIVLPPGTWKSFRIEATGG